MKFYCVADETTVRGFRLAGVRGTIANSPTEAAAAVQMAAKQSDCGVVILTERVAHGVASLVDRIRYEQDRPLIVVIPGPDGPVEAGKSLRALVQRTVGVRLDPERGD